MSDPDKTRDILIDQLYRAGIPQACHQQRLQEKVIREFAYDKHSMAIEILRLREKLNEESSS